MRGRCNSIVKRVVRSTSVPIAELSSPRIRSPSQWPGTARAPVAAATMPTAQPAHIRARRRLAVGLGDRAGEALLHVVAQRVVRGELGDLRAAGASLRVPLRRRGPIHERVATSRSVAAYLPRDRRRGPTQMASDLTHPDTLGVQDRDLLAL